MYTHMRTKKSLSLLAILFTVVVFSGCVNAGSNEGEVVEENTTPVVDESNNLIDTKGWAEFNYELWNIDFRLPVEDEWKVDIATESTEYVEPDDLSITNGQCLITMNNLTVKDDLTVEDVETAGNSFEYEGYQAVPIEINNMQGLRYFAPTNTTEETYYYVLIADDIVLGAQLRYSATDINCLQYSATIINSMRLNEEVS